VRLGLANCAIGTDIGGSLRIPALFCGLFTMKCTNKRISGDFKSTFFCFTDFGKHLLVNGGGCDI